MNSRIGVYICQCGSNISDHVDVEKVREVVEKEEGVVLAKVTMFACADSTQQEIARDIEEQKLDGMVVASCSPKLHLGTFRSVAERAGLNRYNYVQSNIREQGSWAHSDKPAEATEKAIRSVRAAIARTRLSVAMTPSKIPSENTALVIGAGVAGMRAAIDLADTGSKVYLVEKDHFVGGRTAQWGELFPTGQKGSDVTADLYREVMKRGNITLRTGCEVVSRSGSMGNFEVKLRIEPRGVVGGDSVAVPADFQKRLKRAIDACPVIVPDGFDFGLSKRKALYMDPGGLPGLPVVDRAACTRCGECVKICPEIDLDGKEEFLDIRTGAVIIAAGFDPYEPRQGEFGYGEIGNVITLQQFRRLVETCGERLTFGGKEVRSIAWIFCVGSRQTGALEGDNKYCARYCCSSAIHSAVVAKKRFGNIQNYHFTRGVRTYGKYETIYEESSTLGDIYLQSFEDDPPVVSAWGGKTAVKINDVLTEGKELEVEADLVVLVTGMVPRSGSTIGAIMKAPAGLDGFFNEVHPKLKPVETVIDGIFLAGTAQGPKNITETAMSAHSSAIKTHNLISGGEIELEPTMAMVDRSLCEWCGRCAEACPFDAIDEVDGEGKRVAAVNEAACKGCGMCLPVCPVNAVQLRGFTDAEIEAMIDAMSE